MTAGGAHVQYNAAQKLKAKQDILDMLWYMVFLVMFAFAALQGQSD